MKVAQAPSPEYLSKDILDEDFVQTFTVFLRLQYILGSSRVEAKDQFVTSPTIYQKLYTIICIIITALLNVVATKNYFSNITDGPLFTLSMMILWTCFVSYVLTVINTRFANSQENANFFIRMQKLDRLMRLDRSKPLNEILKQINNYSMLLLLIVFVIMAISRISTIIPHKWVYFSIVGSIYNQFTINTELTYCSNLIVYFVVRQRFINCIVKNHLSKNKVMTKTDALLKFSNKRIKKLAAETHDFVTCDTNAYLKEVFDCFDMFQKLYRFQLFLFCLKLVVVSLLVFGSILLYIQRNHVDIIGICSLSLHAIIDISIAIFLGFRIQLFFEEIKETKRLSIAVMAAYPNGHLREKARKMLKITEETPPRLSIYDMWEMDAGIFLSIFGLITSLIVTLLQFAFL